MASLQNNEHSTNAIPYQHHLAVGIDLGTTNSLIAVVRNGKVQILTDDKGRQLVPSIVHYRQQGCTLVGYDAYTKASKDPANTISSIKRMIGRSLTDIKKYYPNLPYKFQVTENGLPVIVTPNGLLNPISVSADILRALALRATSMLHESIEGVVITVPAYFDDVQRQSIRDAARLAGLHVLRLLNEPTAAAIAYGLNSGKEGIIAVYDLGGGTFDISILRLSQGIFEVLSTGGDSALGGDDFDRLLVDFVCQQTGITINSNMRAQRELLESVINAKIALSFKNSAIITALDQQINISCEKFNELILPLVNRTISTCKRALKDANVKLQEILEVIMVGGSSRIPLVRKSVCNFFGRIPLSGIDPDTVVAVGAAIQADILIGNRSNDKTLLLDVIPLSLGIETIGGLVEKIIPRNTVIPVSRTQEFTTFKDNQTAISIHVVQGERELVQDCRSLARFSLRNIPVLPAGKARVQVTFQVDANGLLSVTAVEKSTGVESFIQVKPSYGLTNNEINTMIQDYISHAQQDVQMRMLIEQKIEAERILKTLNNVITSNNKLFSADECKKINNAIVILRNTIKSNDIFAMRKAIKNINEQTKNFVIRCMNQSVSQVLKDQSIDEI